jgi:hypothetical protein
MSEKTEQAIAEREAASAAARADAKGRPSRSRTETGSRRTAAKPQEPENEKPPEGQS